MLWSGHHFEWQIYNIHIVTNRKLKLKTIMGPQKSRKIQEQGGMFHDSVTTRATFAAFKTTLDIHFLHPYIWLHYNAARLSVPVCFTDFNIFKLAVYSCTEDLISNVTVASYWNLHAHVSYVQCYQYGFCVGKNWLPYFPSFLLQITLHYKNEKLISCALF